MLHLCLSLLTRTLQAKKGYTNLHGSDYSEGAVQLAAKLAQQEDLSINFFCDDILNTSVTEQYQVQCTLSYLLSINQFILDKGTFDAISLSNESKANRIKYIKSIHQLLDNTSDARLVLTSCNFTKEELIDQFKDSLLKCNLRN
jgi:hypothetical protein